VHISMNRLQIAIGCGSLRGPLEACNELGGYRLVFKAVDSRFPLLPMLQESLTNRKVI
jgi:hypothetical protein